MTVVEYTLTGGVRIPDWISDGGYWMNPDGSEKMIGVGVEGSIPDNIETFTLEELQARQKTIRVSYPMKFGETGVVMTDDEADATLKDWWDTRS